MRLEAKASLHDVLQAVRYIKAFANEKTLEEYTSSALLRSAVERQLEIIGEALNRLRKLDRELAQQVPECDRIIAFRNILVHAYDVVDDGIVWDVVSTKLTALETVVGRLLETSDDD